MRTFGLLKFWKLREALKMVYDLLEDYAPSWYGEKIRDKAQAALLVKQTWRST